MRYMPRPNLFRTSEFAYHVTSRSNNKEWFYIPLNQAWGILSASLSEAAARYQAEIHAFVLMSNHYHLLISTPSRNLDAVMKYALSVATQVIQRKTGRINHILGGRYRWSVLDSAYKLGYAFKYVYRNPVKHGACDRVEQYPFSTLNDCFSGPPILEGFSGYWRAVPRLRKERIDWLNRPTPKEVEELVGRGLRRYRFEFPKSNSMQKKLRELKTVYGVET